jgi:pyridoxamine 5'-phosphate oxidase
MSGAGAADDPIAMLVAERERARTAGDPLVDVCYLATVARPDVDRAGGAEMRGEVRALLLRDITAAGVGILINRTSPKWEQLRAAAGATLLIHWPMIGRQYRLWGPTTLMDEEQKLRHWRHKRHASRLMEHYYSEFHRQSAAIASHADFLEGIEALRRRWPDPDQVPMPASLVGILIVPDEIEVWHSSPDRFHYRRRFRRSPPGWDVEVLVP